MSSRPFEGRKSVATETTDQFCVGFAKESEFDGDLARTVANGLFPQGVDPQDPRVREIQRKCRLRGLGEAEAAFTD